MVDGKFATIFINQKMADILGDIPEKLTGRKIQEFLFKEDIAGFEDRFLQPYPEKTECQYSHFRQRMKDAAGKPVFFQVSAMGLARQNEPFSGFFGIFRNST
jgi:PAS domain S-box-containing protein